MYIYFLEYGLIFRTFWSEHRTSCFQYTLSGFRILLTLLHHLLRYLVFCDMCSDMKLHLHLLTKAVRFLKRNWLHISRCNKWLLGTLVVVKISLTRTEKKGKFLWGTGLTPKHLGLVYGPVSPPNYRQFPPSPEVPRTERCDSLY
jgi:hypothetical protein